MWLCTKFGFYSIVKDEQEEIFKVRARIKNDLKNIQKNVLSLLDKKIVEDKNADYRFRIFINQEELTVLLQTLSENIDYFNFKEMIHHNKDQKDKEKYYGEIWGVMYQYQQKQNHLK
jgi:ribosomal protein S20